MPLTRLAVTAATVAAVAGGAVVAAGATEPPEVHTALPAAVRATSGTGAGTATAAAAPAAWVRAGVATVWITPRRTRPVDRPALLRHPHIGRWIDHMSLAQRLDLTDRVMTQALRGTEVVVQRRRDDGWSKIRLPDQRGSGFPTGIVGWVPTRQLSRDPVRPATPALGTSARRTGHRVVRLARDYLGVRYLWAGMSMHGIDCSGLTYQVYRRLGVTLARDAADQSQQGRPVRRSRLRAGDLVFFGSGGWRSVHHVGIYAGHGRVLNAPRTGTRVQVMPLSAWPDYWGARRYL